MLRSGNERKVGEKCEDTVSVSNVFGRSAKF